MINKLIKIHLISIEQIFLREIFAKITAKNGKKCKKMDDFGMFLGKRERERWEGGRKRDRESSCRHAALFFSLSLFLSHALIRFRSSSLSLINNDISLRSVAYFCCSALFPRPSVLVIILTNPKKLISWEFLIPLL